MEEQKRRAEADKLAAITALEVRSREFMVEKEEKRRLEARITSMQSQLLIGGHKIEDMPVFRSPPPPCCASPLGRAFVLIQAWGNAFILHAHPVVPAPHLRPHDKTHDCCISVTAVSVCDSCLKHSISKRLDQANQLAVMLPVCMYKATALVLT